MCVDVIKHGEIDTPWGILPRLSLVFETSMLDAHGNPQILTRTFNDYCYAKSALTLAVKDWLGVDLSEGNADLRDYVGQPARLDFEQATSQSDVLYWKITAINPPGATVLQASGNYRRQERN